MATPTRTDLFVQNLGDQVKDNWKTGLGITAAGTGLAGLYTAFSPDQPGESKGNRTRRILRNMARTGLGIGGGLGALGVANALGGATSVPAGAPIIEDPETGKIVVAPAEELGGSVSGDALRIAVPAAVAGVGVRAVQDAALAKANQYAIDPQRAIRKAVNHNLITNPPRGFSPTKLHNELLRTTKLTDKNAEALLRRIWGGDPRFAADSPLRTNLFNTADPKQIVESIKQQYAREVANNPYVSPRHVSKAVSGAISDAVPEGSTRFMTDTFGRLPDGTMRHMTPKTFVPWRGRAFSTSRNILPAAASGLAAWYSANRPAQ